MENQSAKRRDDKDEDEVGSDRISQLPDSVLHHILSFLSPKKAVQTSVLSKSWRHLGPTRPLIDLRGACDGLHATRSKCCENCFCGNSEALLSVVDNTFQRYHDQNLSTQELRLDMCCIDSQSISVLEKWIPLFIKPNSCVTTFRLSFNNYKHVEPNDLPRLDLPSSVFKAESLEDLYLSGFCRISSLEKSVVQLTNLQKLSLRHVDIDDETLEKIMSGCPFLQYADLRNCDGLKTISINKENHQHLKDFKFFGHGKKIKLDVIEIDAPTLQSILIETCLNWKLDRNNYFPHLKCLNLSFVQLSTESFENFSCNFPLLEEFRLYYCNGFDEINLFCPSLKYLTVKMDRSIKVNVDAPNILCFNYSGEFLPTSISFAKASREWKSEITWEVEEFGYGEDVLPRVLELNKILKGVSQSEISLHIFDSMFLQGMQIECGVHDTVVVEKLDIFDLASNLDSIRCLFYALFQICRPRYVTTWYDSHSSRYYNGSHGNHTVAECIWEIIIHEREKNEYYWQENLKEVSIEVYDFRGKVWRHVEGTCLPESSKNQKIGFRLKWRD